MFVAQLFRELGLELGGAHIDIFKGGHFFGVIYGGVDRCSREKFVDFQHRRFGATHVGEPVVDDCYFRLLFHIV